MKLFARSLSRPTLWPLLMAVLSAAVATPLFAAAPVVSNVRVDSVVQGESVVLKATVSDTDGDLDYLRFSVSGPGILGTINLGDILVSGTHTSAELPWSPPGTGLYTFAITAYDLSTTASGQTEFEVFTSRRIIRNITIANGVSRLFSDAGQILTAETTPTANVLAESGGTLIFWAGGSVLLKPGFHAKPGAFFWAAIDHDNDGYSDVEELTDTDGDGMFDAWEVEHGLNPIVNDAGGDLDGDGLTNLQEFQQARDPQRKDNPSIALVIFTPSS